jgi:hypothetical protein
MASLPLCSRCAAARTRVNGCRTVNSQEPELRESMRRSAPRVTDALSPVDTTSSFQDYERTARKTFRVNPALCFYDDGDAPNALAMPDVLFADGPDGTVLIGDKLTQYEWTRDRQINYFPLKLTIGGAWQSLEIVVAHEFAHILQFKRGLPPGGPWQMEPHADFMAGWLLGLKMEEMIKFYGTEIGSFGIEEGTKSMFERGDTYFGDAKHHGEPQFRAAMVVAGFNARTLDLNSAFDLGRSIAGLKA